MKKAFKIPKDCEKEFLRIFEKLSQSYSAWNIWQDFIYMSAASIANAVDRRPDIWRKREDEYLAIVKRYKKAEVDSIAELFALTVMALESNPAQDFLGELYMNLNLSNHWKGQFFTPWSVSEMMARVTISADNLKEHIEKQGYISVCDPACGAGCILLAFANVCKDVYDVNYQQSVLFVGQDVDPVAAKMCYIQMSLLGCPGYIYIGNTLTEPISGSGFCPVVSRPEDLWFTPMYFLDIWQYRRLFQSIESLCRSGKEAAYNDSKMIQKEPLNAETQKQIPPVTRLPEKSKGGFNLRDFFKHKE